MEQPRSICFLQACNPAERWSLEDSDSALPFHKQNLLQLEGAARRQSTLQEDHNDDSNSEEGRWPCLTGNRSATNLFAIHQSYEYKPLPSSASIRLLEIKRGSPDENVLRCRLIVTSMACLPLYDALSYTWGTARETEDLECDGKLVTIRCNLMNALKHLRHINNARLVWADAICINQKDKEEKEKQIPLMRDIYQKAKRVIVWIGEDRDDKARPAFGVVRQLSRNEDRPLHVLSHDASRHLLVLFLSHGWFSRVWIIQEVAMATTVEVLWGAEKVSWEHVCKAVAVLRTFSYQMMRHTLLNETYHAYMLHQLPVMKGKRLPLLYWLQASRTFRCTDPSDRVYSLLGLTENLGNSGAPSTIRPSNTRRIKPLYKHVAMLSMKQMQSLDVLSAVQHDSIKSYRPTWVPRWNFSHSLTIAPLDPELKGFAAFGSLSKPHFEWSGRYDQILHVDGVEFDRVTEISNMISDADTISEQTIKLVKVLARVLATHRTYPTSENIHHVCCWTVTAGKDHYGMLVTDTQKHLADFFRFWSRRKRVSAQELGKQSLFGDTRASRFIYAALKSCKGRRLFYTAKGYIGLGSAALQPGDIICVLCGGTVPMVLRKTNHKNKSQSRYLLIGEAYVHGIMYGEAVNEHVRGKSALASFGII